MTPALAGTARLVLDPLLAVLFPSRCLACTDFLARPMRGPLCEVCWTALPRHLLQACRCGSLVGRAGPCGRCRRGRSPFSQGGSLGPYEGTLRTLVHELKYHGRQRVAARLAEAVCSRPELRALLAPEALLVSVPLHPRRERERGFNQSDLLARSLGKRLALEAATGCLVRRKDTAPQTGLSAAQRRTNVAGAFVVRRRARVAGRVVVLVDDVVTTGATAAACARALLEGGAGEVRLLSVARVV